MLIKVLIVEDELLSALDLESKLTELGKYEILGIYADAASALQFIENTGHCIDIILMDIELQGDMNGIEFSKQITHKNIPIAFITQHKSQEIYNEAKTVENSGYIVKPFHAFTLDSSIRAILSVHIPNPSLNKPLLYVKVGTKREVIEANNIIWIESNRNYCTIHTINNSYILRKSLKGLIESLPHGMFIPIHKSYLVQLPLVKRIDIKAKIVMVNNVSLPLGYNYIKSVRQYLHYLG